MGWLRVVVRVGVLWLLSLVVAAAGMELARQIVLATDRARTGQATRSKVPAVFVGDERDRTTVRPLLLTNRP